MYILTYSYLFIPTETTLSSTLPNETNYDAKSNKQLTHRPLSQILLQSKTQVIFFDVCSSWSAHKFSAQLQPSLGVS